MYRLNICTSTDHRKVYRAPDSYQHQFHLLKAAFGSFHCESSLNILIMYGPPENIVNLIEIYMKGPSEVYTLML